MERINSWRMVSPTFRRDELCLRLSRRTRTGGVVEGADVFDLFGRRGEGLVWWLCYFFSFSLTPSGAPLCLVHVPSVCLDDCHQSAGTLLTSGAGGGGGLVLSSSSRCCISSSGSSTPTPEPLVGVGVGVSGSLASEAASGQVFHCVLPSSPPVPCPTLTLFSPSSLTEHRVGGYFGVAPSSSTEAATPSSGGQGAGQGGAGGDHHSSNSSSVSPGGAVPLSPVAVCRAAS